MNKLFLKNIGDLGEMQRASFYRFLFKGISDELKTFPNPFLAKIKAPTRFKKKGIKTLVSLDINNIRLKGPSFTTDFCIKRDITYAAQLYILGEYSYPFDKQLDYTNAEIDEKNQIKTVKVKQYILMGEIPLMTEEGTFIISGCERVIISQIIRSPGVYFRKEFSLTKKVSYTATIISNKGQWTKFILEDTHHKDVHNFNIDQIYLKMNEFKDRQVNDIDKNKVFIFDIIRSLAVNPLEILDSLKHASFIEKNFGKQNTPCQNSQSTLIVKKLFENQRKECFSIGELGRYRINKKLALNIPKQVTYLTAQDFIAIIDGLIDLKYYDRENDDIDHIKNKQIRSVGELLQNQFRIGLLRLQKSIDENIINNKAQKLNFEKSSYSNQNNWILDPRPITSALKEFFKTSQLSQFTDQINPLAELTHKRRISVFGPNGLKRDHISSIIRDINPSQYAKLCPIETPEGQNAGLISSISMFGRVSSFGWIETPYFLSHSNNILLNKSAIYLNPDEESEASVAFSDIKINLSKKIVEKYVSIKDNYSIHLKSINEVNFITISPVQIMSLATSLIPFIEHNDANRALMGSNMQRQAVPLLFSQKPIVGTEVEPSSVIDSGFVIKSYCEGIVLSSTNSLIIVEDNHKQKIKYHLRKQKKSNQETSINQRPIVWPGEKIFSGQIIADGPSTLDGELSLGRNLTIAYMPWEGYNYEDAIVINERLIYEDCLTSVHIEEYETTINYSGTNSEKLTNKISSLNHNVCRNLDNEGIVKIGSFVKENDVLIGKLAPCEEDISPEARLLKSLYGKKTQNYRDVSLKVPSGVEGRVIDIRIISKNLISKEKDFSPIFSETIRVYIAQARKIKIGDKLAGRHGNKGIISRILSQQDMPYLPDGTPIDIIFNPLGVPSRMNVGQIFECLLGFAGEKLGKRFKVFPFDEIYGKESSRVLVNQKLKEASMKSSNSWVFNKYSPGKILLKDGRTGEYFDNPVTVGKSYILKLIHLVENKIHTRSTGPYSMITEQPLTGKSQKGGQRFGEMEVWALEAYGCSNTLQELLTIKSDDVDGRVDMYEYILALKDKHKPTPSIPEAFLTLHRELNALGLDFSLNNFAGGFYNTSEIKVVEKNLFENLELRLKLRALLSRKKADIINLE
jgi:DNA-directed RNA polymerase subunit beta